MLETIGKLGIAGGIGFVIGMVTVLWVKPTTSGGTSILIVISVIVFTTIGGIVSALRGKRKSTEDDNLQKTGDDSFDKG
jgi:hypothetical protein